MAVTVRLGIIVCILLWILTTIMDKTTSSKISTVDGNSATIPFKITYNNTCASDGQCATINAACIHEICQCNSSNRYHDDSVDTCEPRIGYNTTCTLNGPRGQCLTANAQCSIDSLCLCSEDDYYSNTINQNNACDNQNEPCVPPNNTCVTRPTQRIDIEIPVSLVEENRIIIGWGTSNVDDNDAVRIKLVSPISNQKVYCSKFQSNTLYTESLKSGTEYTFWFYIEEHCIPSKHQELTTYTVPEIASSSVVIARTKEREINVELTPDQSKSCQMYEFNLTSSSKENRTKRINRTDGSKYTVAFTDLTSATEYIVSVAALAGRFRSNRSVSVIAYTRPPPVKSAEVIQWYNSALVLNVTYDGPNSAKIAYCYMIEQIATNTAVRKNEECFLKTPKTQATLSPLLSGTEYIVDIYSYVTLGNNNSESNRSEYSFNFTSWTRPQDPAGLDVISRSEKDLELKWKFNTDNDVEKVVIEVYNGPTLKSQVTFNKGNVTTGNRTISDLDAGTEYTINIYTVIEREINLTSEGNYTIAAYTRPSTPNVNVTAQEENSVTLHVSCESEFDQIRVAFVDNDIPQKTVNVTADGEYIVTQLESGTNYTMMIFSMISGFESKNSTTIETFTRPGPVHAITFPLDSLEERGLRVKWEKPDGNADSYIVHIQNEKYNNSGRVMSNNDLAYNFSGLEAGKQYSIDIVTVWNNLTSRSKAEGAIFTRPNPPSEHSYSIADITTSTFTISLNTSHQPYDFISFVFLNDGNKNQTYSIDQTAFVIRNLSVGMEYNIDVYSIIAGISSKRYQTLISYTLPGKVTNIMGNFEQTTDTNLPVIWTQPQGHVDHYTVNATCKGPNHDSSIKTQWNLNTSGNVTKVALTPLDPGTNCKISVGAVLNNMKYSLNDLLVGEIVESSSNISTREAAPGKVVIESIVTSSTSLNITWKPPNTPNGIIRKYRVLVQDNYRDCIRARYTYSCNYSKCNDVHEYNCSSPSSITPVIGDCLDNAPMNKVFEDPNGARGIVTNDLHPYRNYTVTLQAFTKCWGNEHKSIKQTEIDST